jgi:hypothetical protein
VNEVYEPPTLVLELLRNTSVKLVEDMEQTPNVGFGELIILLVIGSLFVLPKT